MRATYLTALLAGAAVLLASCASQEEIERSREPRTTVYVAPSPASSEATYYYGGSTSGANATSYYGSSPSWPRVSIAGNTTNLLYQPRVDYWDGHKLVARDAVELKSSNEPQSVFGVVTFQATTLVDKTARTVALVNISVTGGDFPSQAQRSAELVNRARQTFPKELKGIPLDQLENSFVLPPQQVSAGGHSLNNTPPRIIISTKPALLIYVDGPPAFRQVTGTGLQRVINTRFLMWKDEAGTYYLRTADGYLQANGLQGPWKLCSNVPPGAAQVESDGLNAATPVDSSTWQAGGTTNRVASSESTDIYVSTSPAELILFQGTPDFVPVSGNSKLLYVANTSGNVFKLVSDQQNYVLLSGRWYRAPSLNGPWQYVSANQLPKDFAEIPDNSPKENVKASVPGTQQATEALIANSIPESTAVARNTTMVPPQFDGEPTLNSIQGTPLRYVANSSTPIIEVDEHSWYACQNGVWFVSSSVNGPWSVATSVPTVIYTIPPDSPLHYVTYVQVYGASPQEVYEGYTPGYMGTEEQDGVVVYGTGYYYPAWVGGVWWAWPYTWCWGWGPCWTPWYGWGFNCGFGWYCGGWYSYGWGHCHPPAPCWGPYRGGTYHAQAVASSRTIGPATVASSRTLGSSTIASTRTIGTSTASSLYRRNDSSGRNIPYLGANSVQTASTVGRSYNSRTGALASGQYAGVQNVRSSFETRAPTAWNTGVGTARPAFSSRYAPSYNSQGRGNAYSGGYYHGSGAMPGARAGWGGGGAAPRGGGGAVHAGGGGGGSHGGFFGGGGGGGGHGGGGGGGGGGGHGSSGR